MCMYLCKIFSNWKLKFFETHTLCPFAAVILKHFCNAYLLFLQTRVNLCTKKDFYDMYSTCQNMDLHSTSLIITSQCMKPMLKLIKYLEGKLHVYYYFERELKKKKISNMLLHSTTLDALRIRRHIKTAVRLKLFGWI